MFEGKRFEGAITETTRAGVIEAIVESNAKIQKDYLSRVRQSRKNNVKFILADKESERNEKVRSFLLDFRKEFNKQRYALIICNKAREIQEQEWKRSEEYQNYVYIQNLVKESKGQEQKTQSPSVDQPRKEKHPNIADAKLSLDSNKGLKDQGEDKLEQRPNEKAAADNKQLVNLSGEKPAPKQLVSSLKPLEQPTILFSKAENKPAQIEKKTIQAPQKIESTENQPVKIGSTPPKNSLFSVLPINESIFSGGKSESLLGNFKAECKPMYMKQAIPLKQDGQKPDSLLSVEATETKPNPFLTKTAEPKSSLFQTINNQQKNSLFSTQQKEAKEGKFPPPNTINPVEKSIFSSNNNKPNWIFGGASPANNNLKLETSNNPNKAEDKKDVTGSLWGSSIFKPSTLPNLSATEKAFGSGISVIGGGMSEILQQNRGSSIIEDDDLISEMKQKNSESKVHELQTLDRVKTSMDSSPSVFKLG